METTVKNLALSVLSVPLLAWGCVHASEETLSNGYSASRTQTYSQRDLLKNWALSRCFAAITQDNDTRKDAYTTAAAYLEFGRQSMDAYEELKILISKYVGKKYGGSVPSEYNTMKCIDMFHSKELEAIVVDWTTPSSSQQKKAPSK